MSKVKKITPAKNSKKFKLKLEVGKSYKLYHPDDASSGDKVYIDYILGNPINKSPDSKLIVYRYWVKAKQKWCIKINTLWTLNLYNDPREHEK